MRRRLRFLDGTFDENREFVTTKPCHGARFRQRIGEPAGDPDEQLVAGRMTQRVVDGLEVVEVETHHRDRDISAMGDGLFHSIEEVRPIGNIQNTMHAKDPAGFPRDARTAFLMEPKEHLAVMNEVDRRKLALRVVYHSHPDHDAYFSATDRAQACSFDPTEPDYPDTVYIVLSIRAGKFARAAAFAWDSEKQEFAEIPLTTS